MDFLTSDLLSSLLAIILIDLVLAGDNAIVIALAARNLPAELQNKAIVWGTAGAIAVRMVMTTVIIYLLKVPGLMLAGGIILVPIAFKLLSEGDDVGHEIKTATGFWSAMRTIVVADALMGLDNVLAIAGASRGHLGLVIIGLLISVPLVVWGSTLVLKLTRRFPLIVYVGAAAIAWTSARMITHDRWLRAWFDARDYLRWVLDVALIAGVSGLGAWLDYRRRRGAS